MTFYRTVWWIAYCLSGLLFRVRVEGRGNIPTVGGIVLACNHCSYVDPVLIGVAAGRELWYVTKREVFPLPLLGRLILKLHAMPIDRSRGDRVGLRTMESHLKGGRAILLFPEGKRNRSGQFLIPKSGVGMVVFRTSVPVVPVYLSGTVNVWKNLIGLDRVTVRFGEPIRFRPDQLPQRRKEAYKSISCEVMQKISDLKQAYRKVGTVAPASHTSFR